VAYESGLLLNLVGFECGLEEDSEMGREKGEETVRRAFLLQLSRKTSKAQQVIKEFFKIHPDFSHNPRSTVEDRFITELQIALAKLEHCRCLLARVP
jgi:hypothetical protein